MIVYIHNQVAPLLLGFDSRTQFPSLARALPPPLALDVNLRDATKLCAVMQLEDGRLASKEPGQQLRARVFELTWSKFILLERAREVNDFDGSSSYYDDDEFLILSCAGATQNFSVLLELMSSYE